MMYFHLRNQLSEDGQLQLDAILGSSSAQKRIDQKRLELVSSAGFEVG
jgi:hypothetical protein